MGIHHLERVFKPTSVAVVAAGEREESAGRGVLRNLVDGGYAGKLIAVNFHVDKPYGVTRLGDVLEMDEDVDLAIIAAPPDALFPIIEQCASRRVGGAIVLPWTDMAAGRDVARVPQRTWEKAHGAGLRILGPGSCGVMRPAGSLNASTLNRPALPGGLALVSQSRSLLAAVLDMSLDQGVGFSHLVSVGAMVDVDLGDLVNHLGNDPEVSGIAVHVEQLTNVRKFMSAARAVSRVKPIVVLKGTGRPYGDEGEIPRGAGWPGRDAIHDAAFRRAGIMRVNTLGELLEYPELMASQPGPAGKRLAIITDSRCLGLMAADTLFRLGLRPVRFRAETLDRLKRVLPGPWNEADPIDTGDRAAPALTRELAEICMSAQEVNGVLIVHAPLFPEGSDALAEVVSAVRGRGRVPLITAWPGGKGMEQGREILGKANIPTADSLESAARAFRALYDHARNLEVLREIPPRLPVDLRFNRALAREIIDEGLKGEKGYLNELDCKALLAAYGIPVPPIAVARSEEEAAREAVAMGYPVVVKIHSPDILNRSDADCVLLDLRNETEVRRAFRKAVDNALLHSPEADVLGVTVQPMIVSGNAGLALGSVRDELFGPAILFGMSGPAGALFEGVGVTLPPLNRLLARRLMEETPVMALLRERAGVPGANTLLLEEIMIRLSQLLTDFPEISSLDMDPLVQDGEHFWVLDAKAVLQPSDVPAPMHLVVSSYPAQVERRAFAKDGMPFLLRPIKPEDATILMDLFNTLSPTSIYFRFFRPIQTLSHEMLARFTQIDYDRDVVLVAVRQGTSGEAMVGVVRLMRTADIGKAEFAIVVGDPWQGRGVGVALLEHCLGIAAERGIKTVWGMVLPENTTMIDLGRKVGFSVRRIPGARELELCIDLDARLQGSN